MTTTHKSYMLNDRRRIEHLVGEQIYLWGWTCDEIPKLRHLKGVPGTLERLGRVYAVVNFGPGQRWKVRFEDVLDGVREYEARKAADRAKRGATK